MATYRSEAWTGRRDKPAWECRSTQSFWAKVYVWAPYFVRHVLCTGHEFNFRDFCKHCGMSREAYVDRAWRFPPRNSYVVIR